MENFEKEKKIKVNLKNELNHIAERPQAYRK